MVDPFFRTSVASTESRVNFDAGLRAHMQRVFNYMGGGLAITGLVAYIVANTALAGIIFGTPLKWLAMLAPFGFMIYLNVRLDSIKASTAQILFWAFCGTMGLSLASIFFTFTNESIANAFFITAATFGAMSLWGYTTKSDLTGFGAFLMMGLMGLFIASIVNLFIGSSMVQWMVSVVGVFVFTGLTAFDVQRIKRMYVESWGAETNNKLAVMGALNLYLNFINAFMYILRFVGDRR